MSHMREAKTGNRVCVFVLVYVGLVTCSGAFGSFLSDDVCKLKTLSENIPSDYRISFNYISKSVGGACWLCLNLYPVESSLKTLSLRFGNLSANRANITLFITMLQGFRFDLDHEELEVTMQTFKCHYKRVKWASGRYFTHVREVLSAAGSMAGEFHDCVPPPCQTPQVAPITPGQRRQRDDKHAATPGLLTLLIIPSMVVLLLIVGVVSYYHYSEDLKGSPEDSSTCRCLKDSAVARKQLQLVYMRPRTELKKADLSPTVELHREALSLIVRRTGCGWILQGVQTQKSDLVSGGGQSGFQRHSRCS